MRQRVVIALALAPEPSLIIADEPTTALDVSVQAQILDLLKNLCKERGTSIILVTHDMGVIAQTTDRVGVLYAGRLAEIGDTREVLTNPKHPYTKGLVDSTPRIDANSFYKELYQKMDELGMDRSFTSRSMNEGFSGGEKKRCEILQMSMLKPKYCILDETDSGLDTVSYTHLTLPTIYSV